FLASSIIELVSERMAIENFIRNVSDKFEEAYNIKLQPLLCENFDDAYTTIRKQEEYNEKIRESEFCFFIFFTKVGEYTREEFDVAREQFEKTGIYTYLKIIGDGTGADSLYAFVEELEKTFGRHYDTSSRIDIIKLRVLLSLKLEEMEFIEIKAKDEECVVEGKKIIPLDDVTEFADSVGFYYEIQDQWDAMKVLFSRNMDVYESLTFRKTDRYSPDLAMRYNNAGIFYADQGQSDKAEWYLLKAMCIREKLASENPGRHNPNLALAMSYNNAGVFYGIQGRLDKAEEYYLKAISIHEKLADENPGRYSDNLAVICNRIGKFYTDQGRWDKAEEFLLKMIGIYEKLASENPGRYNPDLAGSYNNAGIVYSDQGIWDKAEEYYLKAMCIREKLADENPKRYTPDLADSYNNVGSFYKDQGQTDTAEEYHLKAISIREKLADENPKRYTPGLAASYFNYANLKKSKDLQKKALALAKTQPDHPICKKIIAALE
ncbi:MAG: tetratricopeptide repeat protein, partial [Oscillospiraceae bacterium]|nr:tetratricopeptide repeat protein [Oscillospiraceae bacterium]